MEPTVSVVIINYNNAAYLPACLGALDRMRGISEVIVVDDASTDRSVEILRSRDVIVIRNETNLGPVKSRNIGARSARGTYLLFLDADAALAPDYIPRITEFLDRHRDAGVASGKVIGDDGKRMWFNFGHDPCPLRDKAQNIVDALAVKLLDNAVLRSVVGSFRPFTLNFVPDKIRKVDWVVEMALVTRRELFEKLGGFDERFYMFFEGPDYCRRVRKAGFSVYYLHDAVCAHLGGHSHAAERKRIFAESRACYFRKYSHER
jgi:N-acetylglucosaminyl-diphospho-decaprenol L-rhamnosyltransferase